MSDLFFADRSSRAKLRFSGEQRAWFLDQVLTQAFEDATVGQGQDAAMITVHGRLIAFLETVVTEEAILAHLEPSLRDRLPAELGKYVFATRVEIADVTDDFGLVLVLGEDPTPALGADVIVHPTASIGAPARYLWVERPGIEDLVTQLKAAGAEEIDEEELEARRIGAGVPRWGKEMTEKTFPQEVGIDARAVHYDKGCYLGQEAMAKIHFRGKVNRRLVRLAGDRAIEEGRDVLLDGQKVGVVTSAVGPKALALVRRTVESGARVDIGDTTAEVG